MRTEDHRIEAQARPRWHTMPLPIALVALLVAVGVLVGNVPGAETAALVLTGAASALICLQVALRWQSLATSLFHRSTALTLNAFFQVFLVFLILSMVNYVAYSYAERAPWMPKFDFTEEGHHTLSPQTLQVLDRIDHRKQPIEVLAFFLNPKGASREEQALAERRWRVKSLLDRFARKTSKLEVRFVDPEKDPLTARRHGVGATGTVFLISGERKIEINAGDLFVGNPAAGVARKFKGEQVFTSKLLDLLEGVRKKLYFTTGHGEGDLDQDERDGFSLLRRRLEMEGYDVARVNLVVQGAVPADCKVLVVLGARREFAQPEVAALRAHLQARRPAVFLIEPRPHLRTLAGVLAEVGVELRENLYIEVDSSRHVAQRPTMPLPFLNQHAITTPLIEGGLDVALNEATAIDSIEGSDFDVRTILQGSNHGWGETNLADPRVRREAADLQPPVSLGAAVSSKVGSNDGTEQRPEDELRLVAFGDSDFVANGFLDYLPGNGDLLLNALAWVTRDADRLTIRPKQLEVRRAKLPEEAANRLLWGLCLALPGLVAALGFSIWWHRRGL